MKANKLIVVLLAVCLSGCHIHKHTHIITGATPAVHVESTPAVYAQPAPQSFDLMPLATIIITIHNHYLVWANKINAPEVIVCLWVVKAIVFLHYTIKLTPKIKELYKWIKGEAKPLN